MAKVKFDRTAEHKNIGEIKGTTKGNGNLIERYKLICQLAIQKHPDRPIATNWNEYEKIDATPEKN